MTDSLAAHPSEQHRVRTCHRLGAIRIPDLCNRGAWVEPEVRILDNPPTANCR